VCDSLPLSSTIFVNWIDLCSANRVAPPLVFGFAPPLPPLGFGATATAPRRSSVLPSSPLGFGTAAARRLARLHQGLDQAPPPRFNRALLPSKDWIERRPDRYLARSGFQISSASSIRSGSTRVFGSGSGSVGFMSDRSIYFLE
jgi:hypothetical protein